MSRFDLVVIDCDEVLIESEGLAVRTEAEILSGLGLPLTEADIVERFVGRSALLHHQGIEPDQPQEAPCSERASAGRGRSTDR
jgi:beta-phosphoglucomutase-like phosphatase (HAD superfamily)